MLRGSGKGKFSDGRWTPPNSGDRTAVYALTLDGTGKKGGVGCGMSDSKLIDDKTR